MGTFSSVAWAWQRLLRAIAARQGAVILCYHDVVSSDQPPGRDPVLWVTVQELDWQCRELRRRRTVVPLHDLVEVLRVGGRTRGLAAVTFDDGYVGTLRHGLPVLAAHDIPVTLFPVTGASSTSSRYWWDQMPTPSPEDREICLETLCGDATKIRTHFALPAQAHAGEDPRAASFEELRGVVGGPVAVGAHSVTHQTLTRIPPAALRHELLQPVQDIERGLGIRPDFVAYPYGRWNAAVLDAAEQVGYRAGFGIGSAPVRPSLSRFALPRLPMRNGLTRHDFARLIAPRFG